MSRKKTLWIINQYGSTPDSGFGGRHYYLARELAKLGHKVYIIASASHHLLREPRIFDTPYKLESVDGFTLVWVKMPEYSQAHSKQRVLNWLLFPWRIQKLAKILPDKPDTVLSSSPSPFVFLGAQRLAKRFNSRLVFEVRDIWPLTLTEIGGFSTRHPLVCLMQWVEDKAYREADAVVSNLKNSVEHMVSRGMRQDKYTWVPNGFSMDEVSQNVSLNASTASQLPTDKFIVGYTGTIGVANSLNTLIEAADQLREYTRIAFVLVGDGKEKKTLKQSVESRALSNVFFIEPIPKVEIQAMLSRFDACYIGWLDNSLYRFGIGANKIPEYLYSAKPVIHAYSGACDPIEMADAGLQTPAENSAKLAEAVLKLYHMSADERAEMGANGRKVALSEYEYGQSAEKLAGVLFPD